MRNKTARHIKVASHCSVSVVGRVLLLTISGLVHGWAGQYGCRVALAGRTGPSFSPPQRTNHFSWRRGSNAKCEDPLEDDKWGLLSDESGQCYYEVRGSASPASSMVDVAGMMAEWLSLSVSSFSLSHKTLHFSSERAREQYCYEAQGSAFTFPGG